MALLSAVLQRGSFFFFFFFSFFYSPSRIICESHIRDVFRQEVHVVFSFDKKTKKENYGFVGEERGRERERGGKEEKW